MTKIAQFLRLKGKAARRKASAIRDRIKGHLLNLSAEELWYEAFFTRNPAWSSKHPNSSEIARWKHIKDLLGSTGRDKFAQIIDFGCGRGWLSSLLADYGTVTGIEPVRAVVGHGHRLYPNLNLIHGSLEQLSPLRADLVVCSEVIEHITDSEKPAYLKSFANALNPSGFLVITTPRAEVWDEWRGYSDPSQPTENWIDESTLIKMCNEAGFRLLASARMKEAPTDGPAIEVYQLHLFQRT